jgi:hypothetical protein
MKLRMPSIRRFHGIGNSGSGRNETAAVNLNRQN